MQRSVLVGTGAKIGALPRVHHPKVKEEALIDVGTGKTVIVVAESVCVPGIVIDVLSVLATYHLTIGVPKRPFERADNGARRAGVPPTVCDVEAAVT